MKKITLFFISLCLMTTFVIAQAPKAFKYQAVARTITGNLIQNQLVAFRISILQGSPSGTFLYQERHTTNTNNYGLANLDIGNGTVLSGIFNSINWSLGHMYIMVEFDPLGGTAYQNMGTTQLLSTPYSKYSTMAESLNLPYNDSVSPGAGYAFSVVSTNSTCIQGVGHIGVLGETNSIYGFGEGVSGVAYQTEGDFDGVQGKTSSSAGKGVYGLAYATTGSPCGVYGETRSGTGYGVYGLATLTNGINYGVYGETTSNVGRAIYGYASASSGSSRAVAGSVVSPDGYSGYFGGGKFVITSSKIGIGTISPECQVHIISPGNDDVMKIVKPASGNYVFRFRDTSNGSGALYIYDGSANNTIFLWGDGNSFINGGNLGIGTSSPAYKLDIAGVTNLNKGIASGVAIRCNSDEALWYNGTYFSWGYGGTYNFVGNKLKIAGNGNTAPTYELQVAGNAAKSLGGSSWIVSSDLRLKNLNGNYTKGLNEIMALQPVKFSYKSGNQRGLPSGIEQVGFVAQEVQKVFPEAVNEGEDGLLDFNMHPINVALVNSIKELKAKIDKLENENNQMKAENDRLSNENDKITARLDRLETSMNLSAGK